MSLRAPWSRWQSLRRRLDRLAWPLGLAGLVGVAATNWRQWQRDKELLARVKEPPPLPPLHEWPELPLVSVLVAAWNEADFIERHIESFLALRYPHKELIICAGGKDETYELARRYEGTVVKVLEQQPGEGKQRALARGFALTGGSIIFLTDADCLLDDEAFERTLYPVISGEEQAATGSSRPLDEQLDNPFVFTQAAAQLYASLRSPDYSDGLLGRNCVISRDLLECSQGLEAPAPTGTDYVLAKVLRQHGARIRQVTDSRIATRYPVTARAYIRQQRRWLRNVAAHGRRFGERDEVLMSVRTSLTGLLMLSLPVKALVWGRLVLVTWLLLIVQAFLSRLRYLAVARGIITHRSCWNVTFMQLVMLPLDFIAWSWPLADHVLPRRQESW